MPQLLERLLETKKRFSGQKSRGKRVGKGTTIKRVKERADKISGRAKGRRPQIIPSVTEALGSWQAGSRVSEMLPAKIRKEKPQKPRKKTVERQSSGDISF